MAAAAVHSGKFHLLQSIEKRLYSDGMTLSFIPNTI